MIIWEKLHKRGAKWGDLEVFTTEEIEEEQQTLNKLQDKEWPLENVWISTNRRKKQKAIKLKSTN